MINLVFLPVGIAISLYYGWQELHWTSLVVAAGLIFLFAPTALEVLPREWTDGRGALAILSVLQIGTIFLMMTTSNMWPTFEHAASRTN